MAIISPEEMPKYLSTISFEIGHEAWNLLGNFQTGSLDRGRVIENVARKLEDAMDTIEESIRTYPNKNQTGGYLEE
ncbi:MAG: hypothetical protein HYY10_04130 [Candidatus Liptonbacteria bacterium]|nr:hypothetical protein [Candidatus Liptonbacteria bacterium]